MDSEWIIPDPDPTFHQVIPDPNPTLEQGQVNTVRDKFSLYLPTERKKGPSIVKFFKEISS